MKDGVSELRFKSGAGYRVYYSVTEGGVVVVLLCAGDKSSQQKDVEKAATILRQFIGE